MAGTKPGYESALTLNSHCLGEEAVLPRHDASNGHLNSTPFNKVLISLSLDPDLLPILLLRGLGRGLFCTAVQPRPPCLRSRYSTRPDASAPAKEFKVVLENDTLYVNQELAEALGRNAETDPPEGVPLTLNGWGPHYFTIARTGSDGELLAKQSVASGRDPGVQKVLEYLKDC